LTYRTFNINIDREYINKGIEAFFKDTFQVKIDRKISIINFNFSFSFDKNKLNIMMIDESIEYYKFTEKYDIIIDPYFNIHPLNIELKEENN
jgi:hypothetical protein